MKIEKVNSNQLKVFLTNKDLEKRNIRMAEIAFGSEKTRSLFKEVMDIATDEYDFDVEDSQLMIEAIPVSMEMIIIMVTKMDEKQQEQMSTSKDESFKPQKIYSASKMMDNNNVMMFCFKTLDDAAKVAKTLLDKFHGRNYVIKHQSRYYFILENDSLYDDLTEEDINLLVCEYTADYNDSKFSQLYLLEHGEVIIKDDAIRILSEYFA